MALVNEQLGVYRAQTIKEDQVKKYLKDGRDFIDDAHIEALVKTYCKPDAHEIRDILQKSLSIEALTLEETAQLLNVTDPQLLDEMKDTAAKVKKKVYDNRIVTFAPLYLGNFCVNNCVYCGFRRDNDAVNRDVLSPDQIKQETKVLAGEIGHKRLIVVYGEHPRTDIEYMESSIAAIYSVKQKTKHGYGQIRRVNVNAAPLSIEKLRRLKKAGIGTYQVFQETYHHDTYARVHPKGDIKSHYAWRLYAMHRAFEAGVDDVGLGALFGLYDWKFEVMGLVAHALELERIFGVGPHTLSFPRLEPASEAPYTQNSPYKVFDDEFKRIVTVLRLAVPYAGMIITARESAAIREEVIPIGCTQTDASTKIGIGAYSQSLDYQQKDAQQFLLGDTRSLDEFIGKLSLMGYITSFCTAGYRCGRTGGCIMELLKTGKEGVFCKLNAVLTFREWLDDFASEATKIYAEPLINKELGEIKEQVPQMYPNLLSYYQRIKQGERDLYF